jgi:hypothetical protein
MDSCSTRDETHGHGHGWLFEIEVFADLPWYEAWYRHFFRR